MATFRYALPASALAAHRERLVLRVVPETARAPGVAGCHWLVADEAASAVETAERKVRGEANQVPRWILLVESWDDEVPFVD